MLTMLFCVANFQLSIVNCQLGVAFAQAPIIGGNVYGGGNQANVDGSTTVTVRAGDIGMRPKETNIEEGLTNPRGKVFGGARMANVGGNTFVHIDSEHATDYIVINEVYGGNDISGTIGTAEAVGETLPSVFVSNTDSVDATWNTYVHLNSKTVSYYTESEAKAYNARLTGALAAGTALTGTTLTAVNDLTDVSTTYADGDEITAADAALYNASLPGAVSTSDANPAGKVYIGQLFAGGNGNYDYDSSSGPGTGETTHYIYNKGDHSTPIATKVTLTNEVGFNTPEVEKAYLDVQGGSIVYAYGGGNNATVTERTVIHVDNPSEVVNSITDARSITGSNATGELLTNGRFLDMGINLTFSSPSSDEFQIGRFFGGNNKAEMAIRPRWNLQSGKIRNLFSGGNQGNMTCPEGLLLEIPETSTLIVDNLYGGCRMADVKPTVNGIYTPCTNLPGYNFPNEMSARVLVAGGHINNVFGGNDVTGTVYGGNAIGIYATVYGNVYGGGNGNYPYTDDWNLRNDKRYGDLYYGDRDSTNYTFGDQERSVEALNAYRPNAEQVSLRLWGKRPLNPTIILGSVFVGGNCASLDTKKTNPTIELKIGSNVIADKVFLGNNGEGMLNETFLEHYANVVPGYGNFSTLDLTNTDTGGKDIFAEYMEGVCMDLQPSIVFDNSLNGDPDTYDEGSTFIGSFFLGGNVGSMAIPGKNSYRLDHKVNIFEKIVGGSNNANVAKGTYNAAYEGGVLGAKDERGATSTQFYTDTGAEDGNIKDRLELNLENIALLPMRWNETQTDLMWNTQKWGDVYTAYESGKVLAVGDKYYTYNSTTDAYEEQTVAGSSITTDGTQFEKGVGFYNVPNTPVDRNIRVLGANIYGGCYNSGHVNGNVVININENLLNKDDIFGTGNNSLGYPKTGIQFADQRDDVMAVALTVFGAGYGQDTETWGKSTVNHNDGYAFQAFGGGQEGVVGKKNGDGDYVFNEKYSTYVNLKGIGVATSDSLFAADLAEAEYLYGGGNEGLVCGNSYVNLGNGRIYDAFGGSSNADILGHTEVYIGRQPDGSGYREDVFPWIRDIVYGGNDFGGTILGSQDFTYAVGSTVTPTNMITSASTYVRYLQGHVGGDIFGGNYGSYDYMSRIYADYTNDDGSPKPGFTFPHLNNNSFVHFKPVDNANNEIFGSVFGGSEGYPDHPRLNNTMQEESYVLVEDTETKDADRYIDLDFYGGGNYAGLGSIDAIGGGRTIVDLYSGQFHNIYGGSNQEGLIGFTRVNVPAESTAKVHSIFGGGRGYKSSDIAAEPKLAARLCDHYVTLVDYRSENARVDTIYGGNHNCRVAFDTYVNIQAPVIHSNGYNSYVFGGGFGAETVSGRTHVYMNAGSNAYKVYGGGRDGCVYNFESLKMWLASKYAAEGGSQAEIVGKVKTFGGYLEGFSDYIASHPLDFPNTIPQHVDSMFINNAGAGEPVDLVDSWKYYNTNVHIMQGGYVGGYAYGGGYGANALVGGSTYIELKGGTVNKDIYGGGEGGHVLDRYNIGNESNKFKANTNVYVEGGTVRNVYGGGYDGHVGKHEGDISTSFASDLLAVTNVTIGKVDGTSFLDGIPAIQRNAYGGGEGGSVYGTTNITVNNGYIGYRYKGLVAVPNNTQLTEGATYYTSADGEGKFKALGNEVANGSNYYQITYDEELDDQTPNAIEGAGNVFGGGYVVNSYVDEANVEMYGGTVRGSLYGGGEVGPIGAGTTDNSYGTGGVDTGNVRVYRAGKTNVNLYDGWVKRNVFGGGRGQDSWGGDGTKFMDENIVNNLKTGGMFAKGYVFGQTEVHIFGGEVGTDEGVARGYGNVFGGGDIGFVFSAYKNAANALCVGKKPDNSRRYDGADEGYYYKYENSGSGFTYLTVSDEKVLTEDCKVVVEPRCKANSAVNINGTNFPAGKYVPTSYLNYLGNKTASSEIWNAFAKEDVNKEGIIIHNAVFAGGNTSPGSTEVCANTITVFGNATASVHDVYNRDLISIGRGRVGGLYGDGNLTLVDGYRELNITNYGTDYYHITKEITLQQYYELPTREAAYYEIRYKCLNQCTDKDGKTYAKGTTITADEMLTVFEDVTVNELTTNGVDPVTGDTIYVATGNTVSMFDDAGKPRSYYWKENGVCSRYAGRPMNTIQRADFCGVFGSRMVMQGAQDRVPETIDYTRYTINRVREVSLNKKTSLRSEDAGDERNAQHGNYFGIYSVVNFLGALTSDVDFHNAIRVTENEDLDTYGPDYDLSTVSVTASTEALEYLENHPINGVTVSGTTVTVNSLSALLSLKSVPGVTVTASRLNDQTYYDWKAAHYDERKRNNASSHNKVALASGVYLELTTEKGTGTGLYEKDWGLITGVIELDLINVQPGMGGGYVYAKNVHGKRENSGLDQTILTELNKNTATGEHAVTNKVFRYDDTQTAPGATDASNTQVEWETSGNFVHSTQTIIDDCYNMGGKYKIGENPVPAHYWFIKGQVYVYDQYISAYTGSSNAYSEVVSIPLTITSASHGRMTLLNVKQNRYAYYSVNTGSTQKVLDDDDTIELRDKQYGRNDAITYWDYSQLTSAEKNLFVDETYVVTADCKIGNDTLSAGTVLLPGNSTTEDTYEYLKEHNDSVYHVGKEKNVAFEEVFRPSNNVSHDTGYILTYTIDNPNQWNTWYTPKNGSSLTGKKDSKEILLVSEDDYEDGPTYTPTSDGLYGQNDYVVGNIIPKAVVDTYNSVDTTYIPNYGLSAGAAGYDASKKQAKFYPAYIVTADLLECTNKNGKEQRFHKGATLSKEDYLIYGDDGVTITDSSKWVAIKSSVEPAYMVTSTLQLSSTEYIYRNTYMTADSLDAYYTRFHHTESTVAEEALAEEIKKCIVPAYYCTEAGRYGGNFYQAGHNYRGLVAWSSLSEEDRANFTFNYDALDLLIDPTYGYGRTEGAQYQYDGANYASESDVKNPTTGNKAMYSLETPIDYKATYRGSSLTYISDEKDSSNDTLIVKTATDGTILTRTEYERLPNEQYHYAPITVSDASLTYYVVKETIILGDLPYAAGQVISKDTYDGLSGNDNTGEKAKVAKLTFTSPGTYYYCRENYVIPDGAKGHAITSATGVTGGVGGSYAKNTQVPTGVIIDAETYGTLTNDQKNFSIHGLSPTETSTLYVTRNSDILDVTAEKIITVIYQYDYVESDMSGTHITPISERHVLNIHLNFESGIPTVEDINAPEIILPGTTITIPEPYVEPGAYEVTGSGWKLFDNKSDAESHMNGMDYVPVSDPLYLYQDNYYMAYYAKTALGETYSNYVPVRVANYHDLKKVMDATEHHYYIDHKDLYRDTKLVEPKIYINDYSGSSENGLDLFKNLYDLSLITESGGGYTVADGKITTATGDANPALVGQTLMKSYAAAGNKSYVAAGNHLEFFLRTDIKRGTETIANPDYDSSDPESPATITRTIPWTPIASGANDPCFQGILHGDGHTLSDLNNSLFGKLCGDVYNLGVTGSFTSAGVADTGGGYVENCWINTTGTPTGNVFAVFGDPSGSDKPRQIVNCYCQEGKSYRTDDSDHHGVATPKPDLAFYNGEVAYDLNGFYLYKRYCDQQISDGVTDQSYQYYTIDGTTNKPVLQDAKYYGSNPEYCSSGYNPNYPADAPDSFVVPMYVEDRFADGDFRYAAGSIPTSDDERLYPNPDDEDKPFFFPIWPDDYIFFGQLLTYGYGSQEHQNVPSAVARSGGRLSQAPDANRVYRAPAYYRSKTMSMAHFNPNVYLAQMSADSTRMAYPGMTAIDFAGHKDVHDASETPIPYKLGWNDGRFYTPLLDDDGLLSITNVNETRNLLVYTPKRAENPKTFNVLTNYFSEPVYADYYDGTDYRNVREALTTTVYGHLVQDSVHATATNDHLLVDRQDFNCPIEYKFAADRRMWYQRKPEITEFVDSLSKGWQDISLPFTAELVTTSQKGEITHFYSGSQEIDSGKKIGHEYWLRGLNDITASGEPEVVTANFIYPTAAGEIKEVANTFLWDYYYSMFARNDKRTDIYQEYYSSSRQYRGYSPLAFATPYIIGFPGGSFYEFDLSGSFIPKNTFSDIEKLNRQVISFVSSPAATIGVSDDEIASQIQEKDVTYGGNKYTFMPSYMNVSLNGDEGAYFTLDAAGDSYDKVAAASVAQVSAFRPYFKAVSTNPAKEFKGQTRSIVFSAETSEMYHEEESDDISDAGSLTIKAKNGKIYVTSTLKVAKDITIVTAAGALFDHYTIQPGETRETKVTASGVYIVNRKKVSVKVK